MRGVGEYPYSMTNKAKEFHATASLWVYFPTNSTGVSEVAALREITPTVGVALNTFIPTQSPDALQVDYTTGQNMKGHWMTWINSWWGCVNRQPWRDAVGAIVDFWKAQNVTQFQHDDIEYNDALARGYQYRYGTGSEVGTLASGGIGCYCADCQAASIARGFGTLTTANMSAFQRASTTNFWTWLGSRVHSGSGAVLSGNLNASSPIFSEGIRDDRMSYSMPEVYSSDTTGDGLIRNWRSYSGRMVSTLAVNTQTAYEQAFSSADRTRRWMAGSYAAGLLPIVPWDAYAGTGIPRVFAARADVADITGFVRAVGPSLLSGYSLASALGETTSAPGSIPEAAWASTRQVFVTVRYRTSDGRRVIHVVDMRDTPATFTLSWWNTVVGDGAVTVYEPAVYNQATHDAAIASGDRSALAVSSSPTVTVNGAVSSITFGAGLWRIVEVQP